jgi:hypothetical protein
VVKGRALEEEKCASKGKIEKAFSEKHMHCSGIQASADDPNLVQPWSMIKTYRIQGLVKRGLANWLVKRKEYSFMIGL